MNRQRSALAAATTHFAAAIILVVPLIVAQMVAFEIILVIPLSVARSGAIEYVWASRIFSAICTAVLAFAFIGTMMRRLLRFPESATRTIGASVRAERFLLVRMLVIPFGTVGFHFAIRRFFDDRMLEAFWSFFLASIICGWIEKALDQRQPLEATPEKGTKLATPEDVKKKEKKLATSNGELMVRWGPILLPERLTEGHFCVVGTSGSGKTLLLRHMMQSILHTVGRNKDSRAIVYDAKRDAVSMLSGLGLHAPVTILNPFDTRSVAWDIAADITSPATALQVASILIPDQDKSENKHFSDTARALLAGIFDALHLSCPRAWTLRDVLLIGRDPKLLCQVLGASTHTKHLVDAHLVGSPRTAQSYLSTLATSLALFNPIGAIWGRARTRLSLRDWVAGSSILVLGSDESVGAPLDAINRVILQRASELLLQQPESTTRRTWVFLDEAKDAGEFRGLNALLAKGRSKGVRIALGFQDIDGLRSVYGTERANELVGLCATKAILRLDSDVTAQWASQVVGEWLGSEYTHSETEGTVTISRHIVKREAVLPSEFLRLPPVSGKHFEGYYLSPHLGVFQAAFDYKEGLRPLGNESAFEERAPEEQYIEPWTEADNARLRLRDKTADKSLGGFRAMPEEEND